MSYGAFAQRKNTLSNPQLQTACVQLERWFKYWVPPEAKAPLITLIIQRNICGIADAETYLQTISTNLNSRHIVFQALCDFAQGNRDYLFLTLQNYGMTAVNDKVITDYIIQHFSTNPSQSETHEPETKNTQDQSSTNIAAVRNMIPIDQLLIFVRKDNFSIAEIKEYLSSISKPVASISPIEDSYSIEFADNNELGFDFFPKKHLINIELEDQDEGLFTKFKNNLSSAGYKKSIIHSKFPELSKILFQNKNYKIYFIKNAGGSMGNTLYNIEISRAQTFKN